MPPLAPGDSAFVSLSFSNHTRTVYRNDTFIIIRCLVLSSAMLGCMHRAPLSNPPPVTLTSHNRVWQCLLIQSVQLIIFAVRRQCWTRGAAWSTSVISVVKYFSVSVSVSVSVKPLTFLLLARYVPDVAKEESIWDQCEKYEYWRPTTDLRAHSHIFGKLQMAVLSDSLYVCTQTILCRRSLI